MTAILVAGIGNIFQGDDAFGVEIAQRLLRRKLPPPVKVVDFGIRSVDLTYALLDPYDAVILVDAAQRGEAPGAVSIVEPEPGGDEALDLNDLVLDPHDLDPTRVLRLVGTLGGTCRRILLVACEPLSFGGDEGAMGLSAPVAAALDAGVRTVEQLIDELIDAKSGTDSPAKNPSSEGTSS